MTILRSLIPLAIHAIPRTDTPRFLPGKPDAAAGIALLATARHSRSQRNGVWEITLGPSDNYYEEDEWGFRILDDGLRSQPKLIVEVEYFDEGYGAIQVRRLVDPAFRGRYAESLRAVSYTRLNTKQVRTAAFAFDSASTTANSGEKPDLAITGLQHLRAVRLYADFAESRWTELQASIPKQIESTVRLDRARDIVCSAGVQVLGNPDGLPQSLANLREYVPLAKALGFNGIEAYVRWDFVEPAPGEFDWSFYDAVVEEVRRYDLKLFPLLIVGSAYTLPDWFFRSEENVGFVCLEHGLSNPIQSIWSPYHQKHVTRFLQAFGRHYEPQGCLLGVRLGPSGNFGESQYPAQGDWGYKGEQMHLHIGMWAGDTYAVRDFRRWLERKYGTYDALNAEWGSGYSSFEEVTLTLPEQSTSKRRRLDTYHWYTDSMSDWCEWWALEARKAMPSTPIYQSAGGWGAAEIGTDYSAQAKSMLKIDGGIRLTNELDSFHQAYYATRLGATSARLYDIPLGFEPAMGHTARGTAGRMFNCIANGGDHFFTYHPNVFNRQTSIDNWLQHYPLFDASAKPQVDVALLYPQTMNFLSQDTFRYLNAWGFNNYAREIREHVEVDYLDDRLIRDGFLDRYKVLAFAWGNQLEHDVLQRIDEWMRRGGMIIFPCFLYTKLATVEGDTSVFDRWSIGDTGAGLFFRHVGDDEPPSLYADFVRSVLLDTRSLSAGVRIALEMQRPRKVYISTQDDRHWLVLNFNDDPARVEHPAFGTAEVAPYGIKRLTALGGLS